uniref:GATA-type domain-containing protein n=1 Tax=Aegilops tauschii subsp. strangulata TaxID=200361 RepID=A0A453GYA8_AEGTS
AEMVQVEAAADPEERAASGDPKACDDCNTTKTPLWRGGPNGPKSLCNACGIRYRKRRRVAMGLDPEAKRKPRPARRRPARRRRARRLRRGRRTPLSSTWWALPRTRC